MDMDPMDHILTTINSIDSVDDADQLDRLAVALHALEQSAHPERGVDALFGLFERFPQSDGYGVFWSVLHLLEQVPTSQPRLIESVRLQPMEFNLKMVNRLLNAGITQVDGTQLLALLDEVATNPMYSETARAIARDYMV